MSVSKLSVLKQVQQRINLYGKQAVIVGGTSGIGQGIAVRLAQANANVHIVGRSKTAGQTVVDEMKKASTSSEISQKNSAKPPPIYGFSECDASLLKNVRQICDIIGSSFGKIDYLILTQGITSIDGPKETSEKIEQKLALHYYSRYAFAYYLTPFLSKANDPRVVSVFSAGVHKPYKHLQDDVDLKKNYSLSNMASATGLYNDLAVDALSKINKSISYIHIAPGIVQTNWGKDLPFYIKPAVPILFKFFGKTKEDCAEFMCKSIFNAQFKAPGYFLLDQYGNPTKKTSMHTTENVQFLWNHTEKVFRSKF